MSAFSKLTPQHQLAIAHYRAHGRVQHEAWVAAGFGKKSARSTAARWFNTPEALAAIAELDGKALGKLEITAERVLQELAAIGFANIADYLQDGRIKIDAVERQQMAAVAEFTTDQIADGTVTRTKLKLHDKRGALVDLGKHLGLFRPASPFDPDPETEDTSERQDARLLLLALEVLQRGGKTGRQTPAPTKH